MVGLHDRDDVVHRPALERMHGRGPGVVDMAQLGIVSPEPTPALQTEDLTAVLFVIEDTLGGRGHGAD